MFLCDQIKTKSLSFFYFILNYCKKINTRVHIRKTKRDENIHYTKPDINKWRFPVDKKYK
jgi:hypothetical protein